MKKVLRIIIAGIVIIVFDTVVGIITCGWLFRWVYEIEPTSIWRPMTNGPSPIYYIPAFLLSIIFVLVYGLIKKGLPSQNRLIKGLVFGLIVWAVGMLEGMVAMYFFTTIAPAVLIYWTILGSLQYPLRGLIVSAIYGE